MLEVEPGGPLDLFFYNYYVIYLWVLLSVALILFFIAWVKRSAVVMGLSVLFNVPHIIVFFLGPPPVLYPVLFMAVVIWQMYMSMKFKGK
ncbi:hypothetical protein [Salibacterium lacus]|uniref:Uncharacterized protein n=1 Tax=Salibacterium lacus TaxID=1898109 RepID=A0ABW5T3I8_9BACI